MIDSSGCLHEVFLAVARAFPERVAVASASASLTYEELAMRAQALAHTLRVRGVGPEILVGLCTERDESMVVGMLAILLAGGAYVPIDPDYPAERIAYLVRDSEIALAVTSGKTARALPDGLPVVDVRSSAPFPPASGSAATADPSQAAYVIYTSGSTGQPKGVVVEHRNVTRLFSATHAYFAFSPDDVWTMFHSYGFDFSVWEVWGALLHGGKVVIVPFETTRAPAAFRALLIQQKITMLSQTPSAFRQLVAADLEKPAADYALRFVVFGGEALELPTLKPWVERYGESAPVLTNMYGITETTVHVTLRTIRRADLALNRSPIGVPISDLKVLLLDESGRPVPNGQVGEIYVGGPGVARGYLRRPELTAARFVVGVGGAGRAARFYRSGDRALVDEQGDLIYGGRADDQIKVRGFRIEPGEVEACLMRHAALSACSVRAWNYGEGDVRLVAYCVPVTHAAGSSTDALSGELAAHAAGALPAHMRPSTFLLLDRLPLTAHGKVDRAALPEPTIQTRSSREPAPPGEAAARLTRIWEHMLRLEGIRPGDDFFDLGGTSLAMIRLIREVRNMFSVELDVGALVDGVTIEKLLKQIQSPAGQTQG